MFRRFPLVAALFSFVALIPGPGLSEIRERPSGYGVNSKTVPHPSPRQPLLPPRDVVP
jgi:hypothetical protein